MIERQELSKQLKEWMDSFESKWPQYFLFKKSSRLQSPRTYLAEFGSFDKAFAEIGYENPFKFVIPNPIKTDKLKISIDTREKLPISFAGIDTEVQTMRFGDYKLINPETKIIVERKSISDLINTVSRGKNRFAREILKSRNNGYYFVIVVEGSVNDIDGKGYHNSQLQPKSIWYMIKKVLRDNSDMCQILFCDNRENAARIIPSILLYEDMVRCSDLQFMYDFQERLIKQIPPNLLNLEFYPISSW